VRLGAADCLSSGLATHYIPHQRLSELPAELGKLGASAADDEAVGAVLDRLGGDEARRDALGLIPSCSFSPSTV
jgi:hypothetical protein